MDKLTCMSNPRRSLVWFACAGLEEEERGEAGGQPGKKVDADDERQLWSLPSAALVVAQVEAVPRRCGRRAEVPKRLGPRVLPAGCKALRRRV